MTRVVASASRHDSRILALDGLRGVAILGVLLFKAVEGFKPHSSLGRVISQVFGCGWAGVDLFFVLSGFLITGILLDTKSTPHFFRNFYARRTLRIFPIYFAVLFVTFAVMPRFLPVDAPGVQFIFNNQFWLWTYTTNIAFIVRHSVFFDAGWIHLNHFWSLAIEEQFYLFWPVLVFALTRKQLVKACWACVVGALMLRLGLYILHQPRGAMFYPTPCRIDSLAVGGLIAACLRSEGGLTAMLWVARRAIVVLGVLLGGVWIWRGIFDVNDITSLTFGFTVLAAFSACLILFSIDSTSPNLFRRIMENRVLRFFGKYSYGAYVLHMAVIFALNTKWPLDRVVTACGEPVGMLLFSLSCIAATFIAAFFCWHVFEIHFLKAKRLFAYRSSRPAAPIAGPLVSAKMG